jgi:hypothetical protein
MYFYGEWVKMSEGNKFKHLDKWLGPRLKDYNAMMSGLEAVCKAADDSTEMPLFDRIQVIDTAQKHWRPYASQVGRMIFALGDYIEMMVPMGEEYAHLVDAARERRDSVEKKRAELAMRVAGLSGLRAELTQLYLEQEGIIKGDKK